MTGSSRELGRAHRRSGPGRLIIAVYVVFVIGATSRAALQIATRWEQAPLAYGLSALAAAVYVLATVCLLLPGRAAWAAAFVAISVELLGVLVVGTWSVLDPASFPDDTVWSGYGRGYLYVPLVLPVAGLWWLWRVRPVSPRGPRPAR
ncbi:hypothetical protein [Ornithinicoccus halotolerans]|uniref:hypothetical protein n=1 Tax=Ornithinicoccus halotolerans TaxID=1748220 RepID=UPI001296D743|nr:hypothetical protein [Ornithinicoccus halotolerans]